MNNQIKNVLDTLIIDLTKFHYINNVFYTFKNDNEVIVAVKRKQNTPIDTLEDIQYAIGIAEYNIRKNYNPNFEIEWAN